MTFSFDNYPEATCYAYGEEIDITNGFCENINPFAREKSCCTFQIPKGTRFLEVYMEHRVGRTARCGYAVIEEKLSNETMPRFPYMLDYLKHSSAFSNINQTDRPLVLDYFIRNSMNCTAAMINSSSSLACKRNSLCVDFKFVGRGYTCTCIPGYNGNPYLADGCQDINECANGNNNCTYKCLNTLGGYTCLCPNGYFGDGRNGGIGCIKVPRSKIINIAVGIVSGMGFLLFLGIGFWLKKFLRKRTIKKEREKNFKRNGGLLLQKKINEGPLGTTKLFSTKELEKATDHFNETRILGKGGQSTVYKGMLLDGKIVAIKKSHLVDDYHLTQFINEVVILSQINHRNVLKLLGCCLETEVPLLVYEFLPNGTLFDLIHKGNTEFPFTWNMRLKIATDISGALAYLHSASSIPIIHRDIKSTNILLDEKYIAKVSDFGISRPVEDGKTHLTTHVKGTFGYFDPEYFQSSQLTEKSDVYSFGVVLVELLTGRRPIPLEVTEGELGLAARFRQNMERDKLDRILDPQVSEEGIKKEVIEMAKLAQSCLNVTGEMRPTMKDAANKLESIRSSQKPKTSQIEPHDVIVNRTMSMLPLNTEYFWTSSSNSESTSYEDTYPILFNTV